VTGVTVQRDGQCYSAKGALTVNFCFQQKSVVVNANDASGQVYSLSLVYFGPLSSDIHLETPQAYTLDQVVARALQYDFSSAIQFQQMMQARYTARGDALNLLPHVSNTTLVALASGPITAGASLVGLAGDVAPFLFPSRWLQISIDRQQEGAAADSLALMRGAAALNAELIAYGIDHDEQQLAVLVDEENDLRTLRAKCADAEAQGRVPPGTTSHLDSILSFMHDTWDDLAYPLQDEYAALAQAMGFVNPLAVSKVSVPGGAVTLLNGQSVLNATDYEELVLGRAIELRQMDYLISAAKTTRKADFFSFLDPTADLTRSLGAGIGETIKIDKSQIASLELQRNQTASNVLNTLETAVVRYNHSIDDLGDSYDGLDLEKKRKDAVFAALDAGQPIAAGEITSVSLDHLAWAVNGLDALLDYRASLATLQRLLFQGYYANMDAPPAHNSN
jgi:hypothetical protein